MVLDDLSHEPKHQLKNKAPTSINELFSTLSLDSSISTDDSDTFSMESLENLCKSYPLEIDEKEVMELPLPSLKRQKGVRY